MAFIGMEHSVDPLGIVSVHRGISPIDVDDPQRCHFVGTITVGGPFSLSESDTYFNVGSKQLTAFQLMVDHVNTRRCGVTINGETYALRLETYDDHSSREWTNLIGHYLAKERTDVDILLGGYSSGLTEGLAAISDDAGQLLLSAGAAATSVFAGRDTAFGSLPPTEKYAAKAIEALASKGAKTVASVWEDASFSRGACSAIPELAELHGLSVTSAIEVVKGPNVTVLEDVARELASEDPDVVVACVYDQGCVNWVQSMKNANWSPRAQVFTVCVGLQSFVDAVEDDSEYMMGVTPWDPSLNVIDATTGWSAREFARRFALATGDVDVTYHAASAASMISIAVQAIEETNTANATVLAKHLSEGTFQTAYGEISFDENGQSSPPTLLVQYDKNGLVQTVFPREVSSGEILYPMPTWAKRSCLKGTGCVTDGDSCSAEGLCICNTPGEYAVGIGATATCIPEEDFNYISPELHGTVYFFVAVLFLSHIVAAMWTCRYRKDSLVKVSQPICLGLIILGSVVSTCSIMPMGYETGYRDSDDIDRADAACMAVPWLWSFGFTVTFSSLFAKVTRVKKLMDAAMGFHRQRVGLSVVFLTLGAMLCIDLVVLIPFQLVSPLRWERDVLVSVDGYPISSEGYCTSEDGWWFWLALVCLNILFLLLALRTCLQCQKINEDFAESSHIFLVGLPILQVFAMAIPISVLVRDDSGIFYFIRALAVFLQNFSVMTIMFVPKMLRVYKGEDTSATINATLHDMSMSGRHRRSSLAQPPSAAPASA